MQSPNVFDRIRSEWDDFFTNKDNSDEFFKGIANILLKIADFDVSVYRERYVKGRIYHHLKAKKIPSFKEYMAILQRNPLEIQKLKDLLTIHTTDFFRDITPFRYLEKKLIPEISRKAGNSNAIIRILSAACSTGQEVYSLAIIIHHLKRLGIINNPVIIQGLDIDKESVEIAREGIYRLDTIGNISRDAVLDNFDQIDDGRFLSVKQEIRRYCQFYIHDLFKPLPFKEKYDLVLCRNLLIYVSPEDQIQVLTNIKSCLKTGGYIMLGSTEGVALMREADFLIHDLDQRIYKFIGYDNIKRENEKVPVTGRIMVAQGTPPVLKPAPITMAVRVESSRQTRPRPKVVPYPVPVSDTNAQSDPKARSGLVTPGLNTPTGTHDVETSPIQPETEWEAVIAEIEPAEERTNLSEAQDALMKRAQEVIQEKANEKLLELERIIQRAQETLGDTQLEVDTEKKLENIERYRTFLEQRAKEEEDEFKHVIKSSKKRRGRKGPEIRFSTAEATKAIQQETTENFSEFIRARALQEQEEMEKIVQRSSAVDINKEDRLDDENEGEGTNTGLDLLLQNIYERAKKEVEEFEKIMEKELEPRE